MSKNLWCCWAVSVLVGCGAPGASHGAGATAPESADHALLGAPAPEFSLPALSPAGQGEVSLASTQGKVRLVDFWATWCVPCRLSFPKYQALHERYGDRIAILAISEDEESEGILPFAKETGVQFPLLWDADKAVAESFSVAAMPTLFIVDGNGLVRHVHSGFREGEEAQIDAVVVSLLQ